MALAPFRIVELNAAPKGEAVLKLPTSTASRAAPVGSAVLIQEFGSVTESPPARLEFWQIMSKLATVSIVPALTAIAEPVSCSPPCNVMRAPVVGLLVYKKGKAVADKLGEQLGLAQVAAYIPAGSAMKQLPLVDASKLLVA